MARSGACSSSAKAGPGRRTGQGTRRSPRAPQSMPAPPPLRPLLPLAKRLNRNAVTVSAVIMGMTVLTAIVVVHPSREVQQHPSPQPAVDEAPSTTSRPTFLDEPVRVPAAQADTAVVGLVPLSGGRQPTAGPAPADTSYPAPGPPPGSGG